MKFEHSLAIWLVDEKVDFGTLPSNFMEVKHRAFESVPNLPTAFTTYLSNQEVHIFLDKDINLFLEDGLDVILTLAAEVRGGLRDSSGHQGITLIGHLPGQVTRCFVDLLPLKKWRKKRNFHVKRTQSPRTGCCSQFGFTPTVLPSCHALFMTQNEA